MDKVKITFTETCIVDDQRKGTSDEEKYKSGQTVELPAGSANHWKVRGKAVDPAEYKKFMADKRKAEKKETEDDDE